MPSRNRIALTGVWVALLTGVALFAGSANADIRQHILVDPAPDAATVLSEFDGAIKEIGLSHYISMDEKLEVPHNGVSLSIRHVDYQLTHPDGRSITASFFMLNDPDDVSLEALDAYISYNYGYGGSAGFRIRGVGTLAWYEWSPSGSNQPETLEKGIPDWREQYIEDR